MNALASSIVLRLSPAPHWMRPLQLAGSSSTPSSAELPEALRQMQARQHRSCGLGAGRHRAGHGGIHPDMRKVLDASGEAVTVREALSLINQTLDEALAEQEGDFDADTRWALAWFEQSGFAEGEYATALLMSKLGPNAEAARELAYRLYRICDQKNRSQEALGYNALVQSWPEVRAAGPASCPPHAGENGVAR